MTIAGILQMLAALAAFCFILCMPQQAGAVEKERSEAKMTISIALESRSDAAGVILDEKRLKSLSRTLIEQLFTDDMQKSGSVDVKIKPIGPEAGGCRFDMEALFLYRATYTAVRHDVVFLDAGDKAVVISIDGKPWNASSFFISK